MKHGTGYSYPENSAPDDMFFEAWGDDIEQLFCAAGKALANVLIRNVEAVQGVESRSFHLCSENLEMLLFNFLRELIHYKNTQQLLLAHFQVAVTCSTTETVLKCTARGERLDRLRHEQIVNVKAVAMHHCKLSRSGEGWAAHVTLEI